MSPNGLVNLKNPLWRVREKNKASGTLRSGNGAESVDRQFAAHAPLWIVRFEFLGAPCMRQTVGAAAALCCRAHSSRVVPATATQIVFSAAPIFYPAA